MKQFLHNIVRLFIARYVAGIEDNFIPWLDAVGSLWNIAEDSVLGALGIIGVVEHAREFLAALYAEINFHTNPDSVLNRSTAQTCRFFEKIFTLKQTKMSP